MEPAAAGRFALVLVVAAFTVAVGCGSKTTPSTTKPGPFASCPDMGFGSRPGALPNAIAIKVAGMDCGAARKVITGLHTPRCVNPSPPCDVGGFKCRVADDPFSQLMPIDCAAEDRTIRFTFSGGY